jgi:hypothetical protein
LAALAPWPVIQPWMLLYNELGGLPIKANVGSWQILLQKSKIEQP